MGGAESSSIIILVRYFLSVSCCMQTRQQPISAPLSPIDTAQDILKRAAPAIMIYSIWGERSGNSTMACIDHRGARDNGRGSSPNNNTIAAPAERLPAIPTPLKANLAAQTKKLKKLAGV